ncbi:ABC transporter B family member 28, partial [Linum perenne]
KRKRKRKSNSSFFVLAAAAISGLYISSVSTTPAPNSMASSPASSLLNANPTRFRLASTPHARKRNNLHLPRRPLQFRYSSSLHFPPIQQSPATRRPTATTAFAYVSGPASDPNITDPDPKSAASGDEDDEEEEETSSSKKLITWKLLLSLLIRHKLRIGVSVLSLVGCTTCTLSMPIFSGRFFEVLVGARQEPLWKLLCNIGLAYAMEPIFTVLYVLNMNVVWENVMSTLRAQIFRRVLIQKVEFFDRYKVGEIGALLTSDLGSLKDLVSENVSRDRGFRAFSEILGTVCILFRIAPQLAPVLGVLIFSISVLAAVYKRSTLPVFRSHGTTQASMSDCVTETLSAIRTVRSFSGEQRQMSMFGDQVLAYRRSGIRLGMFKSLNESVTRVAVYISLIALYCLGGNKVKAGEISVGTFASFIGYTFTLTFAVQGLVNTSGDLRATLAAVERVNSILTGVEVDETLAYGLEKEIQQNEHKNEALKLFSDNGHIRKNSRSLHYMSDLKSANNLYDIAWSADICLEDVHFSYPLRPDVCILTGLNLTLKCGTITALVGPSGAGKSTIVQLLARFYDPTKGRITIAGEDIRTFEKTEWARVVSIVNQEPVLFSVSVGENIAYGLPDENVSKDDIIKAAKAANGHEFIVSLPQGYDTLVGERGGLLSGGQRQRIAIARALLKNAPILILDEATSALDAVSERLVQKALNHLMKGRTTLVIAHRLSTVQDAHQIAVCSDGSIAELGNHSQLLADKGKYATLVDTQRLAFE